MVGGKVMESFDQNGYYEFAMKTSTVRRISILLTFGMTMSSVAKEKSGGTAGHRG